METGSFPVFPPVFSPRTLTVHLRQSLLALVSVQKRDSRKTVRVTRQFDFVKPLLWQRKGWRTSWTEMAKMVPLAALLSNSFCNTKRNYAALSSQLQRVMAAFSSTGKIKKKHRMCHSKCCCCAAKVPSSHLLPERKPQKDARRKPSDC